MIELDQLVAAGFAGKCATLITDRVRYSQSRLERIARSLLVFDEKIAAAARRGPLLTRTGTGEYLFMMARLDNIASGID